MKSFRPSRKHVVPGIFMVLLVIPLLMAAFAPILAPIPQASAGWTAPPLPDRDEPLPGFQHLLEPLPIVVRDLPDAASQQVAEAYLSASLTDMDSLVAFISAAFEAVPVPDHLESEWLGWFREVINDPIAAGPLPSEILKALEDDPRNADRLVNFAVALFYYGTIVVTDVPRFDANSYESTKGHAVVLMAAINGMFPDNRAALFNNVYMAPLNVKSAVFVGDDNETIFGLLQEWVAEHPDDVTAISLLVRSSSTEIPSDLIDHDQLNTHLGELALSENDQIAAFANGLLGDMRMQEALHLHRSAPFHAIQLAREALGYYDQGLALSDDVSLYDARATALELLGDIPGSVDALERAIELAPDSVALRTRLAESYLVRIWYGAETEKAAHESRNMSRSALELQARGHSMLLSDMQLLPFPGEFVSSPRGLTVDRGHLPYLQFSTFSGGRGGGFVVAFDLIPPHNDVGLLNRGGYLSRPLYVTELASVILGDPQGLQEDRIALEDQPDYLDWYWDLIRSDLGHGLAVLSAARLVDQIPNLQEQDLQYGWTTAANALRFSGDPEGALTICRAVSEYSFWSEGDYENPPPWTCIGETSYLVGDYDTALQSFDHGSNPLMPGYVLEKKGDVEEAERRYRDALSGAPEYFPEEGAIQLRLADILLSKGESSVAIAHYDEAVKELDPFFAPRALQHAHSNRGIARLQMNTDRDGGINCLGEDREACLAAQGDFDAALASDPYNPVLLMNRAWVARLLGDQELSSELMNRALESDPSLYPVQNDLGVVAFNEGDAPKARQYFQEAVAANPQYDLGWWNLGVLEMKKGPFGIFRGQAYLARAVVQNPSLATSSLSFKTDESIYRVEIIEQTRAGAGWSFATASSLATTALGFLAAAFIVFHATTHVLKDKVVEYIASKVESARPWFNENIGPSLNWLQARTGPTWLLLMLTIVVMVFAAIVPAWRGDPGAASATVTLALFALIFAVVTHEFGHRLSARLMKAELEPVQWAPGIGLSLVLLPFNLSSGPFPAQRVKSGDDTTTLWVYLFGPLANLGVALSIYTLYLIQPLPLLRMIAITQLAVMSYALLPFEPLDGAPLAKAQPKLIAGIASFALLAGVLFSVGLL